MAEVYAISARAGGRHIDIVSRVFCRGETFDVGERI